MTPPPLTVAWISDFPVEWLPTVPSTLRHLPRQHPATWQHVLADQLKGNPSIRLHVIAVRKGIEHDVEFEHDGIRFHVLKVRGWRAATLFWNDTLAIKRAMRKIQPDVVHAWGTERGSGLVAARLEYPFVITIQGLLTWYARIVPLNRYQRAMAMLERVSLRSARFVTTESRFAVSFLRKRFPKLQVFQVEHAPNWLFHRVRRQVEPGKRRLLFVGDLIFRKGGDLLIAALPRILEKHQAEFVGVGHVDSNHQQLVESSSLRQLTSSVRFKAALPPEEVAKEMATATMLLLPTRADTSPNAVKEAVVAGVPVVASRVGGIPDYVYPDKNGVLFDPTDAGALVEAVRQAFMHPLFSQGCVEEKTLALTRHYLSPARMERGFCEVYERLRHPL